LRAQSEGEFFLSRGREEEREEVVEEAERGVPGAGEEVVGVSAEGLCGAGEGVEAAGDFKTHSNHPPARPLEMQAARMAARPTRGSWLGVSSGLKEEEEEREPFGEGEGAVEEKEGEECCGEKLEL
jgi:hypothetical protein